MTVRIRKFRPSDGLRPFVRFYYTIEWPTPAPFAIQNHPQGGVDLVLAFRGDTLFQHATVPIDSLPETDFVPRSGPEDVGPRNETTRLSGLFVLPLQEHPFQTTFLSAVDHVGVSLHPEGAHRLLRVDIGECVNSGRVLSRTEDPELYELFLELKSLGRGHEPLVGEVPETVSRLDRFLCRRLETWHAPWPRFQFATTEIRRSRGRIAIPELAERVETSPRSLQRWSRTTLGLTPKRYAMIVRFHSTVRLLRRCPPDRWLDAALGLGYYDQSHFIAEFRRFSGQSPTQFFRREQQISEFYSGRRTELELTEPAARH
ncbi:MAG: AraC family transcriptional regulator [Candidatus Eisenbacteria bacterium]|uniref:AraC family transcriptional regulator n=1 Tax=Eiseniibacteriota bacterium TaxID=2212470 RepID=A0A956NGU8_UNCEI|nr:AraC family transcriptional regulator [Candidatus Eisenbacteria bacterium]